MYKMHGRHVQDLSCLGLWASGDMFHLVIVYKTGLFKNNISVGRKTSFRFRKITLRTCPPSAVAPTSVLSWNLPVEGNGPAPPGEKTPP